MTEPGAPKSADCPKCGEPMRRERNGVRMPPTPEIFWFCANPDCEDGGRNHLYHGG